MKPTVISYSLTGNNAAIAKGIAAELAAEHIRITEPKPRTNGTIALDMLFGRTPQVNQSLDNLGASDLVVIVGPVWLGNVASPLRSCLKQLRGRPVKYAFCSISGGADGPNPKLAGDLTKRVGKAPAAVVDLHIADLLPADPKPTRAITSAYHLKDAEIKSLTSTMVKVLQENAIPDRRSA
jgi:multimeric flavodoxin WrbA